MGWAGPPRCSPKKRPATLSGELCAHVPLFAFVFFEERPTRRFFDSNGDGELSYSEFMRILQGVKAQMVQPAVGRRAPK